MTQAQDIMSLLATLQSELTRLGYWETERPSVEALSSQQPFCVDTLAFNQWLQFIFIERIQALVDQGMALPNGSGLLPLAEEFFKQDDNTVLLKIIEDIDNTLGRALNS